MTTMPLRFVAEAVYSGEGLDFDGDQVVLAEFEDGGGRCIELSRAAAFDDQARSQGMDSGCLTLHSGATAYGAVERAFFVGRTLHLEVGDRAVDALGVAGIEVTIGVDDVEAVRRGLEAVGVPVVGGVANAGAVKDLEHAHPVALAWRPRFESIVAKLAAGDVEGVAQLRSVEVEVAVLAQMRAYLADYGEALVPLPPAAWDTSVAQWMDGYWDVVIDLWTEEAGASDLVLAARVVSGEDGSVSLRVVGVFVP
jgi:hypothetical protein